MRPPLLRGFSQADQRSPQPLAKGFSHKEQKSPRAIARGCSQDGLKSPRILNRRGPSPVASSWVPSLNGETVQRPPSAEAAQQNWHSWPAQSPSSDLQMTLPDIARKPASLGDTLLRQREQRGQRSETRWGARSGACSAPPMEPFVQNARGAPSPALPVYKGPSLAGPPHAGSGQDEDPRLSAAAVQEKASHGPSALRLARTLGITSDSDIIIEEEKQDEVEETPQSFSATWPQGARFASEDMDHELSPSKPASPVPSPSPNTSAAVLRKRPKRPKQHAVQNTAAKALLHLQRSMPTQLVAFPRTPNTLAEDYDKLGITRISEANFRNEMIAFANLRRDFMERKVRQVNECAGDLTTLVFEVGESWEDVAQLVYTDKCSEGSDLSETFMERALRENLLEAGFGPMADQADELCGTMETGSLWGGESTRTTLAIGRVTGSTAAGTPLPRHIAVSGMLHRVANGIYSLEEEEVSAFGKPLYLKHGSPMSVQWVCCTSCRSQQCSRQGGLLSPSPLPLSPTPTAFTPEPGTCLQLRGGRPAAEPGSDIGEPGWSGWAIGMFGGGDSVSMARNALPKDGRAAEHPADVCGWESRNGNEEDCEVDDQDGESNAADRWAPDLGISLQALGPPPDFIYIQDNSGHLSGTYSIAEDVDRRPSYSREDQATIISWDSEEQCWFARPTGETVRKPGEEVACSNMVDVADPSRVLLWQRWNAAKKAWYEDPGVVCGEGIFPPKQLFVCGCDRAGGGGANGVYDLVLGTCHGRPAYAKGGDGCRPRYVLRWTPEKATWMLLEETKSLVPTGAAAEEELARGGDGHLRPHELLGWEEHWKDESGGTGELAWVVAPNLSVSEVGEPPNELFLEAEAASSLLHTRGVYEAASKHDGRFGYEKKRAGGGGWRLTWHSADLAWHLETIPAKHGGSSTATARVPYDAPDPSSVPEACSWERWDEGAREWFVDRSVRAKRVGVPPRRVYVSGAEKMLHPLCGVYFLRGLRNGRPSYGKERMGMESFERGLIYWGSDKVSWRMYSQQEKGEFWHAWLSEDLPQPSFATVSQWQVEDRPSTKSTHSNREQADEEYLMSAKASTGSELRKAVSLPDGMGQQLSRTWPKQRSALGAPGVGPRGIAKLGPMGLPMGSASLRQAARLSSVLAFAPADHKLETGVEEARDSGPAEEEKDDGLDSTIKLTCMPADESPDAVFLTGHGVTLDGVFILQDVLHDGRPFYQKKVWGTTLFWNRTAQTWTVKDGGFLSDDSAGVVSLPNDTPDPTLGVVEWEELATAPTPEPHMPATRGRPLDSRDTGDGRRPTPDLLENSVESAAPLQATYDLRFESIREEDEDDCSEDKDDLSRGPRDHFKSPSEERAEAPAEQEGGETQDEPKAHWRKLPKVRCLAVLPAPRQIFLAGLGVRNAITGIYTITHETTVQQRPLYRLERTEKSTPCTMRYIASQRRWVVERVPQMRGRKSSLKVDLESITFALAGVVYDAPNPTLVPVPWELRSDGNWLTPESPIVCREVRPPPERIYLLGPDQKHELVSGTYILLPKWHQGRPVYKKGDADCVVRYHMEARQWIIDTKGMQARPSPMFVADCNVPSPVEMEESGADTVWRMQDVKTGKWAGEPDFSCYAGEMPPKQVYFTGGPSGLSGVYTFRFRRPRGGRCSYKKDNKTWHVWWDSELGCWIVADLMDQNLESLFEEQPTLEHDGDAFATEDVPHPAACSAWQAKTRPLERRSQKLQEPIKCEPVGKPPQIVMVQERGADLGKKLSGVYFLSSDWYKHRAVFHKQCRASKSENWSMFYSTSNTKWYVHQHGLETTRGASAHAPSDVPDPTFIVPNQWSTRAESGRWASAAITVEAVPQAPSRVFLFGAFWPDQAYPDDQPINGIYVLQEDMHCQRVLYRKEVGGTCTLRFHPAEARWIVDMRKLPQDDAVGACSTVCDCWHPVLADGLWALYKEPKAKKDRRRKSGADSPEGQGSTPNRSQASSAAGLPFPAPTQSGNIMKRDSARPGLMSTQSSRSSLHAPSSISGSSGSGRAPSSYAQSAKSKMSVGSSMTPRSFLSRSSPTRCGPRYTAPGMPLQPSNHTQRRTSDSSARSVTSGQGGRSSMSMSSSHLSSHRGSTRGSSAAGSSAHSGSHADSFLSGFGSQAGAGSASRKGQETLDPWHKLHTIALVPVGSPPSLLYITIPAPVDLNGLFALMGEFGGRPAYRLVDPSGKVLLDYPSSASRALSRARRHHAGLSPGPCEIPEAQHRTSAFGFAIHWSLQDCCWLLAEYARTIQVEYTHLRPVLDISLEEDERGFMRLAHCAEGGPADARMVPLGSILTSINGDPEVLLRKSNPCDRLQGLEAPAVLEFRCEGWDAESDEGLAKLCFDAPHPAAVHAPPWEVSVERAIWSLPDWPVQCRSAQRPPRHVVISGYTKKPHSVNGLYEVLPVLHQGRPAYQNKRGRLAICWCASKALWAVVNVPGASFEPGCLVDPRLAIAIAVCYAPSPTTVLAHGGLWQTRTSMRRRTLQVQAEGPPMGEEEWTNLVFSSLHGLVAEANNRERLQHKARDGRIRFHPEKIRATCESLDLLLAEARSLSSASEGVLEAAATTRRKLYGWLLLECISKQGEKEKPSFASWFETLTKIKAFLRQDDADPTVSFDTDGSTALHLVARYGASESWTQDAASVLYSYGADPEALDGKGLSPLLVAVMSRKLENVRALLTLVSDRAAELALWEDSSVQKAQVELFREARDGTVEALRSILLTFDGKLDLDMKSEDGYGVIHLAAMRNQVSMVDILAGRKADLNLQDRDGNTALHLASANDAHLTALILMRSGASLVIQNWNGSSAFMVAMESGSKEVVSEFRKQMVGWDEVEAILGKERDDPNSKGWQGLVLQKTRMLLELGFGNKCTDPMHPGKTDHLQIGNQLIIQEPTSEEPACHCLELRGILICKELLIPLLRLAGETQLRTTTDDCVHYKSFVRYLVASGVGVFCTTEVSRAAHLSIKHLEASCELAFDVLRQGLGTLTGQEESLVGRAADDSWPMCHQYFAHGGLPWMSQDGGQKRMLDALGALLDVDAFGTVEEICKVVAPELHTLKLVSASGVETLLQPFWDSAYARWLVCRSKKADSAMQARCADRWGVCHRGAVPKTLATVLERKGQHRRACEEHFGSMRPRGGVSRNTAHVLEAGGNLDILRFSLIAESMVGIQETLREFEAMNLESDAMELVFVHNDFAVTQGARDYKDLRLGVLAAAPAGGPLLLLEVRLVLSRYLEIKEHKSLLTSIQNSKAVANAERGMRTRRSTSTMAMPRHRWILSTDAFTRHRAATVWCWASPADLHEDCQLEAPAKAELAASIYGKWHEICVDGSEELLLQDAGLERVGKRKEWHMSNEELARKLAQEPGLSSIEGMSLQRLGMELSSREVTLFRDAEGRLIKVRDYMLLQLLSPDGHRALVRDSSPAGPLTAPRRACDALTAVAQRAVKQELPAFLVPWVRVQGHQQRGGMWLLRDEAPPGGQLPAAKRLFVVAATLDASMEPFVLLRAGHGI